MKPVMHTAFSYARTIALILWFGSALYRHNWELGLAIGIIAVFAVAIYVEKKNAEDLLEEVKHLRRLIEQRRQATPLPRVKRQE